MFKWLRTFNTLKKHNKLLSDFDDKALNAFDFSLFNSDKIEDIKNSIFENPIYAKSDKLFNILTLLFFLSTTSVFTFFIAALISNFSLIKLYLPLCVFSFVVLVAIINFYGQFNENISLIEDIKIKLNPVINNGNIINNLLKCLEEFPEITRQFKEESLKHSSIFTKYHFYKLTSLIGEERAKLNMLKNKQLFETFEKS